MYPLLVMNDGISKVPEKNQHLKEAGFTHLRDAIADGHVQ